MDEFLHNMQCCLDEITAKELRRKLLEPTYVVKTSHPFTFQIAPNKISDMRVIFNDPTTILIVGNKKYISKAHDEEFDEEKGLLMCLAKANGYTHANLKALLKNAQHQTKKK